MAPSASITGVWDLGPYLAQIGHVHDLISRCERSTLVNGVDGALMADTTGGMADCTDNEAPVDRVGVRTAVLRGLVACQDFATPYAINP
ncbi:hypothetical protein ACQP1V_09250 [Microtetraspora malaysiensis]|uniref:hypothetical protein n=1 Tax=Microtetraspora malaysiensis TaxID=161358 RepID=UPI003D8CA2E8